MVIHVHKLVQSFTITRLVNV